MEEFINLILCVLGFINEDDDQLQPTEVKSLFKNIYHSQFYTVKAVIQKTAATKAFAAVF